MSWLRFILMFPGITLGFFWQFCADSFEVGRQMWKQLS